MKSKKEKPRDEGDLRSELLEHAEDTRKVIARYKQSPAWRSKALLALLKNEQAILEGLATLLGGAAAPPARTREVHEIDVVEVVRQLPADAFVDGDRARKIVEEFDNRDREFDRGLEKLNSWIAGGKGALPFQKRESHAYLNRSANSEAMIARIESELMGREGFTRRLGKLKVEGLTGDILVYERGA